MSLQHSPQAPPFGAALKQWRSRRRMSQLDLALTAGVSSRHVAFLETGRAKPSREMVVTLSSAMSVPLAERNRLLVAAGFAPQYTQRPLEDASLAPVRKAYDALLDKQEPYPAILFDRYWNLIAPNRAAQRLLGLPPAGKEPLNLVRMLAGNPAAPKLVANWPQVAHHMVQRLQLELEAAGEDKELRALIDALKSDPALGQGRAVHDPAHGPFIGVVVRTPGQDIALFSTIAEFGTIEDITIRDLRVELFFPADAASEAALRRLAETAGSAA